MKTTPITHRLLIVDDNPAIHADFRKILAPPSSGSEQTTAMEAILFGEAISAAPPVSFALDSAHQGQEALEKLKQALAENRPYAVAFVDVRMPPGWDGIETVSQLWRLCPQLQIVICTAYSDYSWDEMHAKLGCSDNLVLLKKPFDNVEVQQLAHALSRKWELNLQASLRLEQLETMVRQRTQELEIANHNLTRSEERFAKAFYSSATAKAIITLPDRKFVDINAPLATLLGVARAEIIDQPSDTLFRWQMPDLIQRWYETVARHESILEEETELLHPTGHLRQVQVSLTPITLAGESHALMSLQDVTERNLLERQLRQAQKMEGIGQLAAGIAHDFNNILTVIQGHAGMLKSQPNRDPFTSQSVENIIKASKRAATLIRQLLMFSRKQVMRFCYLDLNECVNNSLAMLNRLVGEHVQINFEANDSLPSIHADNSMIEQIIMNLAVNARDAMPNGGKVFIHSDVARVSRPATPMDPEPRQGEFVRLTFRDTGCGMETTILTRIFEPFFTTKGVGKGTGLGLATVFGIVRQHRGWVEVTSKTGQGTTFEIYFPACTQPVEKTTGTSSTTVLGRGKETVLVAEDEESLRDFVATVLTSQGYKVIAAASGTEALKLYEQASRRVDLLLTDMVMPGGIMGGELAERLRGQQPDLKVIYTSGYSPGMAGKDLSLLQRKNFLPKPYSVGRLAQFVREVLDENPEAAVPVGTSS